MPVCRYFFVFSYTKVHGTQNENVYRPGRYPYIPVLAEARDYIKYVRVRVDYR